MVKDFFRTKRPWSEYKDLILGYYLEPYIPKVNTLGKPILIVDCFAGAGKFDDGKDGSPLIIASAIEKWRGKGVNISGVFIEADDENFRKLERSMNRFAGFAALKHGKFEQHLPELATLAKQNTVFLYVDPYSVRGLRFDAMYKVYEHIRTSGASVELLLNLNVPIFMRWALAALKRLDSKIDDQFPADVADEIFGADEADEPIEVSALNDIAGGDYWKAIASDASISFVDKVEAFMQAYSRKMTSCFKWVGWYDVKTKYHHQVPKYLLVYATRSDHGIDLMNDAMCKARREFVKDQFPRQEDLFGAYDTKPASEQVDIASVADRLLSLAPSDSKFTRRKLRISAMQDQFCRYTSQDYNAAVGVLIKTGRLFSETGRSRINDKELLSVKPLSGGSEKADVRS
jgi:three-Cys-motif partner protein